MRLPGISFLVQFGPWLGCFGYICVAVEDSDAVLTSSSDKSFHMLGDFRVLINGGYMVWMGMGLVVEKQYSSLRCRIGLQLTPQPEEGAFLPACLPYMQRYTRV